MGSKTKEERALRLRAQRKRRNRRRCLLLLAALLLVLAGWKMWESRTDSTSGQLHTGEYPESMVVFAEKYPQALSFVLDYPEKKDRHEPIDLTGEVKKGEIPLFLQWDERWGYEIYGDDFLGVNGCGPTSLSMVLCGLTGETGWNPWEVAKFSNDQGYYVPGVGTAWGLMDAGAGALGLQVHPVALNEASIVQALQSGKILICSMGPGDFTYTGHFIVLTGIDEDGRIRLQDCNSPENSSKTWEIETLVSQMAGIWGYSAAE